MIMSQKEIHDPIPAVAYLVEACNKTLVFCGDTNSEGFENLKLENTDLFVAHKTIPETTG